RLPEVLLVVPLAGRLVERGPAGGFDDLAPRDESPPLLALRLRRTGDAGTQLLAQDAVRTGQHAVEDTHEFVDRVRDTAAVEARVQVAFAGPDGDTRRDDAASAERDRRTEARHV